MKKIKGCMALLGATMLSAIAALTSVVFVFEVLRRI